jgi:LPXTG-motif cell wall-anchored protein
VSATRRLALVVLLLASAAPATAQRPSGDVDQILAKLADEDLVERTYGALALQHFARKQWSFALFSHTQLRPWQRALAPAMRPLVDLLGEDGGLEWIDQSGNTEQTTTPRAEATRALLALERASVEPLIDALDRPPLHRKADELLRQIVRGGPPGHDRAAWQRWWSEHQHQPLHNERGQWWLVVLGLVLLAAVAALVFRKQRR